MNGIEKLFNSIQYPIKSKLFISTTHSLLDTAFRISSQEREKYINTGLKINEYSFKHLFSSRLSLFKTYSAKTKIKDRRPFQETLFL